MFRRFFQLALVLLVVVGVAGPAAAGPGWGAGYDANPGSYPVTASHKLTIPWFNCDGLSGGKWVAPWSGVSITGKLPTGYEVDLVQMGSTMFCNRDVGPDYKWVSVWYENWPKQPVNVPGVTAKIGDTLTYSTVVRPHQTTYTVKNLTTGESWTGSFDIEISYVGERDWIAEGYQGTPNFGRITFVRSQGYPNTAKAYDDHSEMRVSDLYASRTKFDVIDTK